jgi:adhesin transport system membrane fusion protein
MINFFKPPVRDTDFMSELEAATRMRPAKSATMMLFAIIGLVLFGLFWAGISEVEQITRGQGQVVPTQEIQIVQSFEGGILAELLVTEGQQVQKGEILLRISDVQFSSEERGAESKSLSLQAKKARLIAEANGTKFSMPKEILEKSPKIAATELALYESRQSELQNIYAILDDRISKATAELSETGAQVNRLVENRKLLQQELAITREMVKKRAVPKLDEIRLERELSDISGQISAAAEKKKGLEAELAVARKERGAQDNKFRSQALGEMNEVETEITGLQESLKTIGDRVYRTELRSPINGVVNNIALKTIGGVVEPAMRLVEIVPLDDKLKIIARVKPNDIAFLHPGQDVKVKITAYETQKYGTLKGKLVRVGANSVTDREGNIFFEIEVRTDKNHMGSDEHPLPVTPGMVAQTEIITGKRTILEYLLKPILRARNSALTER